MAQYQTVNLKLSNTHLNKLKLTTNSDTEVNLIVSSNVIDNSKDEANFPHTLYL